MDVVEKPSAKKDGGKLRFGCNEVKGSCIVCTEARFEAVFTLVTRGRFFDVGVKIFFEANSGICTSAQK